MAGRPARRDVRLLLCIGFKETGEWKEEIVYFDAAKPATARAALPDGTAVWLAPRQDPREVFADWLVSPKNPWFARNIRQSHLVLAARPRHHQ